MIAKAQRLFIGIIGAVALAMYSYQIISLWLFRDYAITWFAEVAVYMLVWAMFVGVSELVRVDSHIRADFVISHLSVRTQRWFELINCLVGIIFSVCLIWYGWKITFDAFDLDERSPTGLAFPLWIYYSAAPVGGALLLLRYVQRFWAYLMRFDEKTMALHTAVEI
ncbi:MULTISPECIES: TRAP transporter small permease [unclassified Xanthobacter]|uniref:TRAP transporter small permease n=1 Tax=unclassified Xanthobacter TaxID=2623496 RepID=UPI001EE01476|nr:MULTISPECIES: TRAP transporter small permease [unclassified Xanthobacter]